MKKLNSNSFFLKQSKNNSLTIHILFHLQNHPTFHSEEEEEEESALLVYLYY